MSTQLQQDHFKVKPKDHSITKASTLSSDSTEVSPEGGDLEGASYLSGRGAQLNTKNKFLKNQNVKEHVE